MNNEQQNRADAQDRVGVAIDKFRVAAEEHPGTTLFYISTADIGKDEPGAVRASGAMMGEKLALISTIKQCLESQTEMRTVLVAAVLSHITGISEEVAAQSVETCECPACTALKN